MTTTQVEILNPHQWFVEINKKNGGARRYTEKQKEIIANNQHLLKESPTFGLVSGNYFFMEYAVDKVWDDEWTESDVILYRHYKKQYPQSVETQPVKKYSNIFTFMLIPAYVDKNEEYEDLSLSLIKWGVDWDNTHFNRKKLDAKRYYPQFAKYFV